MLCRAKVNLTLHVGAPLTSGRWDGYHPVESLVVFADFGDEIELTPALLTELSIGGPFGAGLSAGADNLISEALIACDAPAQSVFLTKHLPVSSGLGGGSANAAAIMREFDPDHKIDTVSLGADVPVCRLSQTAMMEGIGERVTPLSSLGTLAAVLVNPGVPVSTAEIFRRYDSRNPEVLPKQTARDGSLMHRALSGTNDLEADALMTAPEIGDVLTELRLQTGCELARMSGSGATCFGVFDTDTRAQCAAEALSRRGWWVVATRLGDPS